MAAAAAICAATNAEAEGGSAGGSIGGSIGGSVGGSTGGGTGGSTGSHNGGSIGGAIVSPAGDHATSLAPRKAAREPVPKARRARRAARYEAVRRGTDENAGARGRGTFDGLWQVSLTSSCVAENRATMRIVHGHFFNRAAYGSSSGSVSPSGAYYATGHYSGMSEVSSGRLSGSTGSGTFRRSDGCAGTWSAHR